MTKENLLSSAEKLQQEIKRVNERNQNIIKAHNNGQSEQQIMDTFEINEDTLIGVLKKAKRDGLLKTDVVKIEDTKPSERPKPKPPVLKENEIEKPKSKGRPKKEPVAVVEVEKPESQPSSANGPTVHPVTREMPKSQTYVDGNIKEVDIIKFFKELDEKIAAEREQKKSHEIKDLKRNLEITVEMLAERDSEIAQLKKQLERFNHSQDLVIGLMRNTIALVDQAEESRTEGRQ